MPERTYPDKLHSVRVWCTDRMLASLDAECARVNAANPLQPRIARSDLARHALQEWLLVLPERIADEAEVRRHLPTRGRPKKKLAARPATPRPRKRQRRLP